MSMDKNSRLVYWNFLKRQIQQRAQQRSESVVCASGEATNEYLDLKELFARGSTMKVLADCLWDYIMYLGVSHFDAIGGPTMGADVVSHATASLHMVDWFSVRDEPKDHGLQRLIEGRQLDRHNRVILTDDVVSTGSSLLRADKAVRETGAEIVAVIPIVDRAGLGKHKFANYYPLFTHEELGIDPL